MVPAPAGEQFFYVTVSFHKTESMSVWSSKPAGQMVKTSKSRKISQDLARFLQLWAIFVSLVSYKNNKHLFARLKQDETSKIRRSNDVRLPVPDL